MPQATADPAPAMHPQLQALAALLRRHEIPYFVDSGTLLGLVRDGRVLSYDKDIDLGIWGEHADRLRALVPEIEALGYKGRVNRYGGQPYSFLFRRPRGDGLIASIGVYRIVDDVAWRIALFGTDNPHRPGTLPFYLAGALRTPLRHLAQAYRKIAGTERVVGRWPWRHVLQVGTWVVPYPLLAETKPHDPTGLPIPARAEEYLDHRYGDWRQAKRDWLWYRDDLAVRLGPPDQVLRQRSAQG